MEWEHRFVFILNPHLDPARFRFVLPHMSSAFTVTTPSFSRWVTVTFAVVIGAVLGCVANGAIILADRLIAIVFSTVCSPVVCMIFSIERWAACSSISLRPKALDMSTTPTSAGELPVQRMRIR
jgi:hypothetical protein